MAVFDVPQFAREKKGRLGKTFDIVAPIDPVRAGAQLLGDGPAQAVPHNDLDDLAAIQFSQAHGDGVRSCHVVLPPSREVRHYNLAVTVIV